MVTGTGQSDLTVNNLITGDTLNIQLKFNKGSVSSVDSIYLNNTN